MYPKRSRPRLNYHLSNPERSEGEKFILSVVEGSTFLNCHLDPERSRGREIP